MKLNKNLAVIMTSGMLLMSGCDSSSEIEKTSEVVSSEEITSEDTLQVSEDGVVTQAYEAEGKKYIRAGYIDQGFMTLPEGFIRITDNEEVKKNKALQFADSTKQNKITWTKIDTAENPDVTTEAIATKLLETYQQMEIPEDQVEAGKVDKADMFLNPIVVVLKKPEQQILTVFFQDPKEEKMLYTIAIEGSKEFVEQYTQLIFTWNKQG